MSNIALVVMARYPEAGKTKTRLGRIIGDDRAVSLYQAKEQWLGARNAALARITADYSPARFEEALRRAITFALAERRPPLDAAITS